MRNRVAPAIRDARALDLPAVVGLYRRWAEQDDGNARDAGESDAASFARYEEAFAALGSNPDHRLLVAEHDGAVVGTFHLSQLRYVAFGGGKVATIEAVYVHPDMRGAGIGEAMIRWAIDQARQGGCFRLQLTSNKRRHRAHAFYERLGFVTSHEGMKLVL
jgi:GNAT superfamily N-acetyltransferase